MPLNEYDVRKFNAILDKNFPRDKITFTPAEMLFVLNEFSNPDKYITVTKTTGPRYKIVKYFVRYLFERAKSNLDNMVLVTSPKGFGKSSLAVLMALLWCKIIDIKFNPKKHLCYSNEQVTDAIDTLPPWSPIICDEAVQFCLSGDTLIRTLKGTKRMDEVGDAKILSYNQTKKKIVESNAYFVYSGEKEVFEVKMDDGNIIKTTKEHKFLVRRKNKNIWLNITQIKNSDEVVKI